MLPGIRSGCQNRAYRTVWVKCPVGNIAQRYNKIKGLLLIFQTKKYPDRTVDLKKTLFEGVWAGRKWRRFGTI